jgi:hypothetical protein
VLRESTSQGQREREKVRVCLCEIQISMSAKRTVQLEESVQQKHEHSEEDHANMDQLEEEGQPSFAGFSNPMVSLSLSLSSLLFVSSCILSVCSLSF